MVKKMKWKIISDFFNQKYNLSNFQCNVKWWSVFALVFSSLFNQYAYAWPDNFSEAKQMARVIWQEHRETFYCGCRYDKYGIVNYNTCDYEPEDKFASKRITWEHVVPASWYGKDRPCWNQPLCVGKDGHRYKGRSCCRKIDKPFREMEADLHNLVPALREVNMARSNFAYTEFKPEVEKKRFRQCEIYIDENSHTVEPREEVKGMVARIHFYMQDKYGIHMNKKQERLMHQWDKKYPPQAWEIKWNQKIALISENHE